MPQALFFTPSYNQLACWGQDTTALRVIGEILVRFYGNVVLEQLFDSVLK